jgi:transaldolase
MAKDKTNLSKEVHQFVTESFSPKFGQLKETFETDNLWQKLKILGTELWLDTGSIDDVQKHWTQEFSALTTNNTLLNREIQTGRYDSLIPEINKMLDEYDLSEQGKMLETAFILNAWHGLRLAEKFDAFVSVEEHTALAHNVDSAVRYAKRYHAICPERFIVKIPFTPSGLLATRRLSGDGILVNHTLGFSARQNYLIARISKPAYANVFLGRLNSFVKDNALGDGSFIGEKATLASQTAVRQLRQQGKTPSKQIGASFREGGQVRDLAGIDVMTIPPKVAGEFKGLGPSPEELSDKTEMDYTPGVTNKKDIDDTRLDTLWDIPDELVACCDNLEKENIDEFSADDLVKFFSEHKCGDILVSWTDEQIKISSEEGKIPKLDNWKDILKDKVIGLDSLMNLAGLMSFTQDQAAMDTRVKEVLGK